MAMPRTRKAAELVPL